MISKGFMILSTFAAFSAWLCLLPAARATEVAFADQSSAVITHEVIHRGNSSAEQRRDLKFTATVQPLGFGPIPEFSQGVSAGYFLNPDSVLQLEYSHAFQAFSSSFWSVGADDNGTSTSSRRWFHDLDGYALGLHLKQFMWNSFYVKGGLDYRNLDRSNKYVDVITPDQDAFVDFAGSTVAAGLSIGNQWQFSHFTIGCDWIGLSAPFEHWVTNESLAGPVSEDAVAKMHDEENRYLAMLNIQLLRFYMGASF